MTAFLILLPIALVSLVILAHLMGPRRLPPVKATPDSAPMVCIDCGLPVCRCNRTPALWTDEL